MMTESEIRAGNIRYMTACAVLIAGGGTLILSDGFLPTWAGLLTLTGTVLVANVLPWWNNSLPWGS